jgi:hypothetical protein
MAAFRRLMAGSVALRRRNGNPGHGSNRLHGGLLALLLLPAWFVVVLPPAAASGAQRRPPPERFSDLAELTPANVQGLLPLLARTIAPQSGDRRVLADVQRAPVQPRSIAHGLQVEASADVDLRLQRFLDDRTNLQLVLDQPEGPMGGNPGCEISYLTGASGATVELAAALPGERELRAWDPIERRVVWSVTEALPISARTLLTAGGLLFYGTSDGWLKALDARTGRTLWKHQAEGRSLDAPFSFRGADGHQYVAVYSSPHGSDGGRTTLLIFALAH